ncbi:Ig-like domain-containing protein, partial [Gramella lutea]
SVAQVEFFEGTNSLGVDADGSDGWSFNWNGVSTGNYELTAVATDDDLETNTSEIINITVDDPNQLPTIAITAPLNNEVFTAPADIEITVDASDADGSVTQVEFFEGTNSLGVDADGSDGWSISWNSVATGNYELTAVATDDDLETTTSEIVSITVNPSENVIAPSGLIARWISNTEVYLNWNDNSQNEDGFILERSTKSDFSNRVVSISIPANTTTYIDRNLNSRKKGGKLYYRIKAVNGSISSDYSNTTLAISLSGASIASPDFSNEILNKEELAVYPNPTEDETTIKFTLNKTREYTLDLYNSIGSHLISIGKGKARIGMEYSFEIEVGYLPDGIYFIMLKTRDSNKTTRLIIKR